MATKTLNESTLRGRLDRRGYTLRKSRARESTDNYGGYRIVETHGNVVVAGERYTLSLEDVAAWLREEA